MSPVRALVYGAIVSVVIAVVFLTGPPFWFGWFGWSLGQSDSGAPQNPGVLRFTGGCAPFQLFAQNRWLPYGAAIRSAPGSTAKQLGSRDPNQSFTVDGWVHSMVAYPTNTPPWNNDVWFHLSDGSGWVSFAGVRAVPTFNDPTLRADGGQPVDLNPECQGNAQ